MEESRILIGQKRLLWISLRRSHIVARFSRFYFIFNIFWVVGIGRLSGMLQ